MGETKQTRKVFYSIGVNNWMTTNPPLLVNIVIEWTLINQDINLGKYLSSNFYRNSLTFAQSLANNKDQFGKD